MKGAAFALIASFIAVAASLTNAGGRSQQPTFSSRIEAVRVDALVTKDGVPLRGLRAEDFEVLDNGVPQQVDLAVVERLPINAVLAFDMSASVAGQRLEHLREAGRGLLAALKPEDQAALVTFSDGVALGSKLTSHLDAIRTVLDRASGNGDTALVDGALAAMILAESNVARGLVIVFSDGLDTSSWLSPDLVLQTARRADTVVYAFSVGRPDPRDVRRGLFARPSGNGNPFLRDLTAATGGRLYESASTGDLPGVFVRIITEFRDRYVLSYSPSSVSGTGWHAIQVRVKRRGVTVRARPGYAIGE